MRTAIILLLVLSTLLVGCVEVIPDETGDITQPQVTQEEALDEIDNSLLPEDEEIEIGEMI